MKKMDFQQIKYRIALMTMLACILPSVFALNNVENTRTQNTVSENSIILNNMSQAKYWNLTEQEWISYKTLMLGQGGHYYVKASPPEVLGYYAKNEIERQHYAEILAQLEHEKVERELKFDRAFQAAAIKLYANEPIIKPFDMSAYTPIPKNLTDDNSLKAGDRLVFLINLKDEKNSNRILTTLITQAKQNAGVILDIYCANATDDNAIQVWAKTNHIPVELVTAHRITLNRATAETQYLSKSKKTTGILLVRNGKSTWISGENF